jgi:hypothetical protein
MILGCMHVCISHHVHIKRFLNRMPRSAYTCIFMHIHRYSCMYIDIHAYTCIFIHIHASSCLLNVKARLPPMFCYTICTFFCECQSYSLCYFDDIFLFTSFKSFSYTRSTGNAHASIMIVKITIMCL